MQAEEEVEEFRNGWMKENNPDWIWERDASRLAAGSLGGAGSVKRTDAINEASRAARSRMESGRMGAMLGSRLQSDGREILSSPLFPQGMKLEIFEMGDRMRCLDHA